MNNKTYYQCTACTTDPDNACLLKVNREDGQPSKCPYGLPDRPKWVEVEIVITTKEKL
jgi:hypothetical protein